jgi:UDP-glucuronate decarboxylase
MVKLMESDKEIIGPINIGNPNEFTIIELADLILKLTSSKSEIIFKSLPEDDPKQRQPNINLAKDKLNWEPKVALEDGLKETIKYFKALLQN